MTNPFSYLFLPTKEEMAKIDFDTISSGDTSLELIDRVGNKIFNYLKENLEEFLEWNSLVICGAGNNGSDGLALSLEMHKEGIEPVLIVIKSEKYSADFLIKFRKAKEKINYIFSYPEDCSVLETKGINSKDLPQIFSQCDFIIDAILGTGQKNAPKKNLKEFLKNLKPFLRDRFTLAIDMPTGIDANSGSLLTPDAFKANITLTIDLIKRGMLQDPARTLCGEIQVIDLDLKKSFDTEYSLGTIFQGHSLSRRYSCHKGDFGNVLVLAGSAKYRGASILASHAALKIGAGGVFRTELENAEAHCLPEIISIPLKANSNFYTIEDFDQIEEYLERSDVILLGPGIGQEKKTSEFLFELLRNNTKPAVLDADALNIIGKLSNSKLEKLDFSQAVFTPHPREAERLLGIDVQKIQADRYTAAEQLNKKYNATIVLKGAGSIILDKQQKFVCPSGNPYMATAGSGDVLAGFIAGMLAQKFPAIASAYYGAVTHGIAGNMAVTNSSRAITASEIISFSGKC